MTTPPEWFVFDGDELKYPTAGSGDAAPAAAGAAAAGCALAGTGINKLLPPSIRDFFNHSH